MVVITARLAPEEAAAVLCALDAGVERLAAARTAAAAVGGLSADRRQGRRAPSMPPTSCALRAARQPYRRAREERTVMDRYTRSTLPRSLSDGSGSHRRLS